MTERTLRRPDGTVLTVESVAIANAWRICSVESAPTTSETAALPEVLLGGAVFATADLNEWRRQNLSTVQLAARRLPRSLVGE